MKLQTEGPPLLTAAIPWAMGHELSRAGVKGLYHIKFSQAR